MMRSSSISSTTAAILFIGRRRSADRLRRDEDHQFRPWRFLTVGGYAALSSPILGLPAIVAAVLPSLLGGLSRRRRRAFVIVRPLYHRPLDAILATWGLGIVIGQAHHARLRARGAIRPGSRSPATLPSSARLFASIGLLLHPRRDVIGALFTGAPDGHRLGLATRAVIMNENAGARARHRQRPGAPRHLRPRRRPCRPRRRAVTPLVQRRPEHGRCLAGQRLHAGAGLRRLAADPGASRVSCSAGRRCWSAPTSARSLEA